jgi:ABC-type transport system involved in cytochrome c biogenesis ATPase subunit
MGNDASKLPGPLSTVGDIETNVARAKEVSRMDSMVRNRVRTRVQHSMKLVIRGCSSSGKTSLWRRLQGLSFSSSVSLSFRVHR